MKAILTGIMLFAGATVMATDSIVCDDGTGAQISFALPVRDQINGKAITFTTFRLIVRKDGKFLLFTDLPGKMTEDGTTFSGKIIIPSGMIDSAEIVMLGTNPNQMSSRGIEKKIKVADFKKVFREKSWTGQK